MNLYSAARNMWWLTSEVLDAAKQWLNQYHNTDDDTDQYADQLEKLRTELVEREAREDVSEPAADCGLAETSECLCDPQWLCSYFVDEKPADPSAAPGVADPVEAADNDPGAHPPTRAPGSQTSLTAGELRSAAIGLLEYTHAGSFWHELAARLSAAADAVDATLSIDPASDLTMRQRLNEDRDV